MLLFYESFSSQFAQGITHIVMNSLSTEDDLTGNNINT